MPDCNPTPSANFDAELGTLAIRYLDGSATPEETERLDAILTAEQNCRKSFVDLCIVVTGLSELSRASSTEERTETPEAALPPPVEGGSPFGFLGNVYQGTVGFFSNELPLSMLIATAIMASVLYLAWVFNITHYRQFAKDTPAVPERRVDQGIVYVGRITGMKDCRWAASDPGTVVGALVSLDRRYALSSGLLEITYKTGAKVLLEGPCTYRVESSAGGFLKRGKLTAKIKVQGSGFRGQGSECSRRVYAASAGEFIPLLR